MENKDLENAPKDHNESSSENDQPSENKNITSFGTRIKTRSDAIETLKNMEPDYLDIYNKVAEASEGKIGYLAKKYCDFENLPPSYKFLLENDYIKGRFIIFIRENKTDPNQKHDHLDFFNIFFTVSGKVKSAIAEKKDLSEQKKTVNAEKELTHPEGSYIKEVFDRVDAFSAKSIIDYSKKMRLPFPDKESISKFLSSKLLSDNIMHSYAISFLENPKAAKVKKEDINDIKDILYKCIYPKLEKVSWPNAQIEPSFVYIPIEEEYRKIGLHDIILYFKPEELFWRYEILTEYFFNSIFPKYSEYVFLQERIDKADVDQLELSADQLSTIFQGSVLQEDKLMPRFSMQCQLESLTHWFFPKKKAQEIFDNEFEEISSYIFMNTENENYFKLADNFEKNLSSIEKLTLRKKAEALIETHKIKDEEKDRLRRTLSVCYEKNRELEDYYASISNQISGGSLIDPDAWSQIAQKIFELCHNNEEALQDSQISLEILLTKDLMFDLATKFILKKKIQDLYNEIQAKNDIYRFFPQSKADNDLCTSLIKEYKDKGLLYIPFIQKIEDEKKFFWAFCTKDKQNKIWHSKSKEDDFSLLMQLKPESAAFSIAHIIENIDSFANVKLLLEKKINMLERMKNLNRNIQLFEDRLLQIKIKGAERVKEALALLNAYEPK